MLPGNRTKSQKGPHSPRQEQTSDHPGLSRQRREGSTVCVVHTLEDLVLPTRFSTGHKYLTCCVLIGNITQDRTLCSLWTCKMVARPGARYSREKTMFAELIFRFGALQVFYVRSTTSFSAQLP